MSELGDKKLVDSTSLSSHLADPGAIAGLAVGFATFPLFFHPPLKKIFPYIFCTRLACALALITALIAFCCFKTSR